MGWAEVDEEKTVHYLAKIGVRWEPGAQAAISRQVLEGVKRVCAAVGRSTPPSPDLLRLRPPMYG